MLRKVLPCFLLVEIKTPTVGNLDPKLAPWIRIRIQLLEKISYQSFGENLILNTFFVIMYYSMQMVYQLNLKEYQHLRKPERSLLF